MFFCQKNKSFQINEILSFYYNSIAFILLIHINCPDQTEKSIYYEFNIFFCEIKISFYFCCLYISIYIIYYDASQKIYTMYLAKFITMPTWKSILSKQARYKKCLETLYYHHHIYYRNKELFSFATGSHHLCVSSFCNNT